jgi:hypothetical protein
MSNDREPVEPHHERVEPDRQPDTEAVDPDRGSHRRPPDGHEGAAHTPGGRGGPGPVTGPDEPAPDDAGQRPGAHPEVRRSGSVRRPAAIAIAVGLGLAGLTYLAAVTGIVGG